MRNMWYCIPLVSVADPDPPLPGARFTVGRVSMVGINMITTWEDHDGPLPMAELEPIGES